MNNSLRGMIDSRIVFLYIKLKKKYTFFTHQPKRAQWPRSNQFVYLDGLHWSTGWWRTLSSWWSHTRGDWRMENKIRLILPLIRCLLKLGRLDYLFMCLFDCHLSRLDIVMHLVSESRNKQVPKAIPYLSISTAASSIMSFIWCITLVTTNYLTTSQSD